MILVPIAYVDYFLVLKYISL